MAIQPSIDYNILTAAEEQWVQSGAAGNVKMTEVSTPTGTASGIGLLYTKSSDSKLYFQNDSGTEYDLTAAGGAPGGSNGQIQYKDGSSFGGTNLSLTGDITGTGTASIATTIANSAVTYAKIQNISVTDKVLGRFSVGAGIIEEISCTSAGRALIDDATTAIQRTTLGLGTIATQDSNNVSITGGSVTGITDITIADGGTGASSSAVARTNLGLAIGTNIQAYDVQLDDIAALTPSSSAFVGSNASNLIMRSAAAVRGDLGLVIGTNVQAYDAQLADVAGFSPASSSFVGSNTTNLILRTAAQTRGDLSLIIGTNVQAWDNDLDDLAALTHSGSAMIVSNGTDWVAQGTATVKANLDIVSATLTKEGLIEIATAAETTTGTDAGRAVSPDALADSDYGKRIIQILMTDPNAAAQGSGTGTSYVRIDSVINNFRLVGMEAGIATGSASAGGGISITPRNITKGYNMVSEPVWIDANEGDSSTAGTAVVITAGSASVSTGDKIRLTIGGSGTATGMIASLIYQL